MSRLQESTASPHQSSLRAMLKAWPQAAACCMVLGVMYAVIQPYLSASDEGDDGPLSPYRLAPAELGQACRADACSVSLAPLETGTLVDQRVARYLGPPAAGTVQEAAAAAPGDLTLRFALRDGADIAPNAEVRVRFDTAMEPFQPLSGERDNAFRGYVAEIGGGGAQDATISVRAHGHADRHILAQRVSVAKISAAAAIPEQVWLVVPRSTRTRSAVRVPSGAIVRDAQQSWVWAVLGDVAVPVQVHASDCTAQACVVAENLAAGVGGMPVAAAHWRAMDAQARAQVYAAAHQAAPAEPRLLANVQVINPPGAALRPGLRIRKRNGDS